MHPAIVLRNSFKNSPGVMVLPISSKKPQNIKDFHIEIGKIVGLKEYHWANIMHIVEVSKQRIIIPPEPKSVEGKVLNKISGAIITQIALRGKKQ
ncbi:type II toxin-antitoxin system PemK/MazF family toxin [Neomoorella thermoacetica]|uniref:type II toxin-antitoxin system PemK/MazF family toxin n=1 Tax=Neomoorella thermoacetica TaxID=1525 RepID=UPI0009C1236A